ncbi:uncharacterized protein MELLADRAFT_72591 [Melampsora larici-populina 98AG31]|uniref:Pinin/SDK/MemA protein domain-containing protein n=1 Tax=Melampsora larici-populina (strain 98AG31 / pathotype 3-4-7) TaxID=747676 RepID=F4RWC8_MELLP|nr:uncharacterized protein MELLADRAFT_72591 [Melampsora larici-populina 98AG31]EGG03263.1 hypothetical protein MELLADRAFT_72591 [Melampsora larici-populina 98AG31]
MTTSENELLAAEVEFQSEQPISPNQDEEQKMKISKEPNHSISEIIQDDQPRKKLKLTEADKKRNVRMFGALMGTLSKFQDETSKTRQTEAAQRRAAVENRLQAKLKIESEALHQLRTYELEEKNLKSSVIRKTEELAQLSECNLIHFSNQLAFSNYLCTSSTNVLETDNLEPPVTSHPLNHHPIRPIYWLPNKLLPEQEERIDRQRRETREVVEDQQRIWLEEKSNKQNELEQLCIARDTRLAEIEAEKLKSKQEASSSTMMNSTTEVQPIIEDPINPSVRDLSDIQMRDETEGRQDTPDLSNLTGRDEDAVEY